MSDRLSETCHTHDMTLAQASSERRTWLVVAITGVTMLVELVAGYWSGSMALVADGWHMATHVGALTLAGLAYWYARRLARSGKFSFGAGKVYALAGYTNALLLGVVALAMIVESIQRLQEPLNIDFSVALPVAVIGLVVNLASMLVLRGGHHHDHDEHEHDHDHHEQGQDHNLKGAIAHVAADALTSVLAIAALVAAQFAGWTFLDPVMGIVGGAVILRWGLGLIKSSSRALLDAVPSEKIAASIRSRIESIEETRVHDLHLWELAPGRLGCIVSVEAAQPRELSVYRKAILEAARIDHLTVEVCARA